VSTPELALLHDWFLERLAIRTPPLVVPEDLSLVPIEPMEDYLRRAGPPGDRPRYNVIVLMLESLPARRIGLYGYARPTTPALDRLAREALVFEDALAVASSSNYAQLAALSSLYPLKYAVRDQYTRLDYPRTLLWDVLGPLGWTTAILSSQDERWNNMHRFLRTPRLGLFFHSPSLREQDKVSHGDRVLKLPDRVTMDRVLEELRGAKEPFAWYVNLQGTHHPYLPVAGCAPRFQPAEIDFPLPYGRWPREKADVVGNAYDNALLCVDAQVGRLDAALRERGLAARTILVVTADHGEGFYEHATPSHGVELYRELLHVPWLMRAPGLAPGRFVPTVSQLDILPTLLGRMGFSQPHPNFQGVDVLVPGYTDRGRDFCASVQYSRNLTAIERDDLKLIRAIHTGAEEFFDLGTDRGEQHPLDEHPRAAEYRRRLQAVVERQLVYYADEALVSRFYPPPLRSDVPPARWRPVGLAFDFENGRYAPTWTPRGTAFGSEPASRLNPGRIRLQSGFRGRRFASSLMADGDAATGELLSSSFAVVGERLRVLVGGGEDPGVGVELQIDGKPVLQASGHGADGFSPVWWDLSRYRGQKARIRIYDDSAKPMGHILVDDVRQFVRDRSRNDDS
jgi:arylsulfatase A-like enzyme